MRKGLSMAVLLAAAFGLTACDTFFGEEDGPPLPGERISVLRLNRTLVPDPALSDLRVRLPEPYANTEWPQPGGFSTHAMDVSMPSKKPRSLTPAFAPLSIRL